MINALMSTLIGALLSAQGVSGPSEREIQQVLVAQWGEIMSPMAQNPIIIEREQQLNQLRDLLGNVKLAGCTLEAVDEYACVLQIREPGESDTTPEIKRFSKINGSWAALDGILE